MPEGPVPLRGEIWWMNFSPTKGREQQGDRPALVVSDNRLNSSRAELAIVLPMTTTRRDIPWHIPITPDDAPGLSDVSYAMCQQIRTVSTDRLRRRAAHVSNSAIMEQVEDRLRVLLRL